MEHHWISFALDLRSMPAAYWMQLGEARSKCSHLSRVPLPQLYADQLHQLSLAKGVHATTAIEGNTLTEEEVRAIIERRPPPNTQDYQVREVENVIAAYNWVFAEIAGGNRPLLTPELIADFNRRVLEGLDGLEQHVVPGEYRRDSVVVGKYRAPDWQECPELVAQMCEWLNGESFAGDG